MCKRQGEHISGHSPAQGSRGLATPRAVAPVRLSTTPVFGAVTFLRTFASPGLAQDGIVQGRTRDEEGSAVTGASVVLTDGSRVVGSTITDRLGSFRIHSLRDEELLIGLDVWVVAGPRAPHVGLTCTP